MARRRVLHIANDPMVCGEIRDAGIDEGDILWLGDKLSFGPVPSLKTTALEEWCRVRASYWQSQLANTRTTLLPPLRVETRYDSLMNPRLLTGDARICIWAGPSLDEQLFLAWVVEFATQLGLGPTNIGKVVVTEDSIRRTTIPRLSQLHSLGFKAAGAASTNFNPYEMALVHLVWGILTSTKPHFPPMAHDVLPPLACAPEFLKRRYPLVGRGVPQHIWQLFECLKDGPLDLGELLGQYMSIHGQDLWAPTDIVLRAQLESYSEPHAAVPLIQKISTPDGTPSVRIALTQAGHDVLAGKLNNAYINGLDEWIGGVHINSGSKTVWFYDPSYAAIVSENQ